VIVVLADFIPSSQCHRRNFLQCSHYYDEIVYNLFQVRSQVIAKMVMFKIFIY